MFYFVIILSCFVTYTSEGYASAEHPRPSPELESILHNLSTKKAEIKKWSDFPKALAFPDDSEYVKKVCAGILSPHFPHITPQYNVGIFQRNAATNWCQRWREGKVGPDVGKIQLPQTQEPEQSMLRPTRTFPRVSEGGDQGRRPWDSPPQRAVVGNPQQGHVGRAKAQLQRRTEVKKRDVSPEIKRGIVGKRKLNFERTVRDVVVEERPPQSTHLALVTDPPPVQAALKLEDKKAEMVHEVVDGNLGAMVQFLLEETLPEEKVGNLLQRVRVDLRKPITVLFDQDHFELLKSLGVPKYFDIQEGPPISLGGQEVKKYRLVHKKSHHLGDRKEELIGILLAYRSIAETIQKQVHAYYDNLTVAANSLRIDLKEIHTSREEALRLFRGQNYNDYEIQQLSQIIPNFTLPKGGFQYFKIMEKDNLGHKEFLTEFQALLPREKQYNPMIVNSGAWQIPIVIALLKQADENFQRANTDFLRIDELTRDMLRRINDE